MKKLILLSLLLTACSNTDEQFCKCMAISEEFNGASVELLTGEESTMTSKERLALKKKKDEACKDYVSTPGDELKELKKGCE